MAPAVDPLSACSAIARLLTGRKVWPIRTSMLPPRTLWLLGAAVAANGLAFAWLAASPEAAEEPEIVLPQERLDGLAGTWDRLSRIDFAGAYEGFNRLRESGDATEREANLGIAVTLLNLPPKTKGNIDRAEALLAEIKEADSRDETGMMAWTYYARIPHLHRREPRYEEAFARYEALAEARPDHFLGQYARLKSAVLDLMTADFPAPEAANARVAHWEEKASNVKHPILLRNLAHLFGEALIENGGSMQMAQKFAMVSVENEPSRFDIMRYFRMRSINLAMINEDYQTARKYLVDYLNAYPGTWKTHAEKLLAEVEANLAAAK